MKYFLYYIIFHILFKKNQLLFECIQKVLFWNIGLAKLAAEILLFFNWDGACRYMSRQTRTNHTSIDSFVETRYGGDCSDHGSVHW